VAHMYEKDSRKENEGRYLSLSGAAYSRIRYSAVNMMTQAVSRQNSCISKRSPHVRKRPSTDVGSSTPQATVSMMFVSTDTAMKNPMINDAHSMSSFYSSLISTQ